MTAGAQKRWKIGISILLVDCCLMLGGRIFTWYSAVRFGNANFAVFASLGSVAFRDTEGLMGFYAQPDVAAYEKRVNALSFIARDHQRNLTDFKSGMIYLSRQFSLPLHERFRTPPTFKNLILDHSDSSEEGLNRALEKLVLSYRETL